MPNPKEINIIINTNPHRVPGPTVTFEQILQLDGINVGAVDVNLYDVDWTHGNRSGSLTPGKSVEIQNGMRFDAGKSNRS